MKRIIFILVLVITLGNIFAQDCTLRIKMPEVLPNIGEEFYVEVWMDVLEYPGYTLNDGVPTLAAGQMGVSFDEAVITPVKTAGPPALQTYAHNMNSMFSDYNAVPAEGYPNPGDLRFVSYTTFAPGMDPSFYGGMPFHMWDLQFIYNGGDIEILWQTEEIITAGELSLTGELEEKFDSFWVAWDNEAYNMTYVNISNTITNVLDDKNFISKIKIWSNNQNIYVKVHEISGEIVVFNMMGQEVLRSDIISNLNTLPINTSNTYYVVKVKGDNVSRTEKIYLK